MFFENVWELWASISTRIFQTTFSDSFLCCRIALGLTAEEMQRLRIGEGDFARVVFRQDFLKRRRTPESERRLGCHDAILFFHVAKYCETHLKKIARNHAACTDIKSRGVHG